MQDKKANYCSYYKQTHLQISKQRQTHNPIAKIFYHIVYASLLLSICFH